MSTPHMLHVAYECGFHVTVTCPDEALGADRPCAVWANDDARQKAARMATP